jgi:hypothetical protein
VSRSPRELVPPQKVGPSPFTIPKSPIFSQTQLDHLQTKFKTLKSYEIDQQTRLAKDLGITDISELEKRLQTYAKEKSQRTLPKTDPKRLAASLQEPDFKPSSIEQIELGRRLQTLVSDRGLSPPPTLIDKTPVLPGMRRLAIGGDVQRLVGGTSSGPLRNRKRITGLLDVDKLRDSKRAREAMQKLGFYNPKKDTYDVSGYRDSLANASLAERQKKNGAVDYMAADLGSPGAGKSTFGLKGKGPKRYIETIEDLQEMIASGSRVSIRNAMASLDEDKIRHLSKYDRIRVLSSTTPEEMKELKGRLKNRTRQGKESIAATGVDTSTQFGRKHTIKAQSSEDTEAMLRFRDENGKQIIDESKIATYSISTGKRKGADEVPQVEKKDIRLVKGAFAPTTLEGHGKLFSSGDLNKRLVVNIGPNEGLTKEDREKILGGNPEDAHGTRSLMMNRRVREAGVKKTLADLKIPGDTSRTGEGFVIPSLFKVGKNRYVQPGENSEAIVGEDRIGSSDKYKEAGYKVHVVPRPEGIDPKTGQPLSESGSNARARLFQGDFSGLSPSVQKMYREATERGVPQNTLKVLPNVVKHVEKRVQARVAAIDVELDKLLTSVPGGRLTQAFREQNPELAKEIERLRAKKSGAKDDRSDLHALMAKLARRYPEKYGFNMDDEEESSFKPMRPFTGKRFQTAAIGGLIQRFARGTSSPLSAPDEIPIMAQKGEFVLNKHAAGQIGPHNLEKLNRGGKVAANALNKLPKYHTGGMVQKFASGGSVQKLARGGDVVLQKATSDLGFGRLEKTILGIENILGKVSPRLQQSFGKLLLGLNRTESSMNSLGANSHAIIDKNNQANKRGPVASSVVAQAALRFGEERSRNVPFSGMGRYDKTKEVATATYVNRAATGNPNKTGINPHYENRTWDTKSHTTSSGEKFVPYNKSQPVEGASKNLATNLYQGVKPEVVRQLQMNNGSKAPVGSLKASHEAASIITTTHNEAFEKSKNDLGIRSMTDKKEISKATSKAKKRANQAVRTKMGVPISNSDLEDVITGSQRVVQNQKDLDERDRLGRVATAKDRVENKVKPQKPKGYISGMKYYANEAKKNNTTFGTTTPGVKSTVLSEAQNYVEQRNQGATQRGYVDYGAYLEDKAKKTKSHTKLADIRKKQERFTASNAIIQRETQKKEQVKTGRVIPKEVSQREREFFDNRGSAASLAQNNKIKAKSNARIKEVTNIMSSDPTTARTGSLSATPTSAPQAITATAVSKTLAEKREAYFQKTGKRLPGYVETGPTPSHYSPMSATGREAVERKAAPGLFHGNGKGKRINAPLEPKDVGGLTVEEHVAQQRSNRRQRKSGIVGADATQERKDIILDEKKTGQRIIESNAATKVGQDIQDRDAAEAQARIAAKQKGLERLDSRKANSAGFSPAMQSYGRIKTAQGQGKLDTLKFSAKNKNNQGSLLAAASTQLSGNFSKALGSASLSVGNFAASFGKANFSTMFASLGAGFAKIGGGVTGLMANFVGLQRTVVATQGKLAGMTKGQAQTALKSGRITKEDYDGAFGRGSKSKAMFHSAKDQIPEINSDFEKREKTAAGKSKKQALIDAGFGKGGAGTDAIRKGGSEGILARAKMNRTMDKLDNNSVGGAGPIVPVGPMDGGGSGGGGPGGRRGRRGRVGRAAAPAAPVSSRGGGGMGGMGGYMGQMAVSMAGSAAVEQYAKGLGGEKTLEGRQASNYGGSIVAGASTGLMMGSMIGSVVPGVGTVVGGAVGAGLGAAAGAGYAYMNSGEIGKQFEDEQRRDKMGRNSKKAGEQLAIMGNKGVSVQTRNKARDEAFQATMEMSQLSAQEQESGLQKTGMFSSKPRKTAQERADSAQDAADANTNFLTAEMQRTGKTLDQVRASMKPEQWNAMASSIADTDVEFQKVKETQAKGSPAYEKARKAAEERAMASLKAADEAIQTAKENAKLSRAMSKVTASFERMAKSISDASARTDQVLQNGKIGIEAIDNPIASVQQGQISKNRDVLSNPDAYSIDEVQQAARQYSGTAGSSAEAMAQAVVLPRKLEQSFGSSMQEARASGKNDEDTRASVKKAVMGTVTEAFGPDLSAGMQKKIDDFLNSKEASGELQSLNFEDLLKGIPELADKMAASGKVLEALKERAKNAAEAIRMQGDAARSVAEKGQQIRNVKADTYSTIANSTLGFRRATGEKISYKADAGVRNQARAIRLGTTGEVAASPQAMLDRYNKLQQSTKTATTAQQQTAASLEPQMLKGDEGAIKQMQDAARTTAEFAQATQQARDEIMNLPNDIKENIGGIMQELQDVMQERAAKIGAAGGLMEKILTSTPKDLRKMGNTFSNLNKTLSGKGVSFQESYSANTAYNQVRRQGGSHMQAQRSAQEAYAQESGDTLSMAKELAPLLGAVDPEAQNKMMGSVYENMFAARGMDTSKMMVGDKSMKDYIDMMKKGAGKDPKVEALNKALQEQQTALTAAAAAAEAVLVQGQRDTIAETGRVIKEAMEAGAAAIARAIAEGENIGITAPGDVASKNRQNQVKNNKKDIEEAQQTLDSATSTEEEKKKARIVKMEKEQENAVLSGSKSAADVVTKHGGETKEQFEQRKQKLIERENEIKKEKAAAAQNPQTTAAANQAATTTPQTNNVAPSQTSTAPTAATNTQNQAATPTPTTGVVPPQAAPATTSQVNNVGAQAAAPTPPVYGGTQPAPTTSATAATTTNAQTTTAVPTPQVNTSGTSPAPIPQDPGDAIMGKMNEDVRADSLSTEEQTLKELQTNTGAEKYSDSEEDQKVRKEAIQYQKFKVSLLKGKSKEEAGKEMFGLGENDTMTEAQQAMVDNNYKDATNTFADRHQISGPRSDVSKNAVVESAPEDVIGQMTESQKADAIKKSQESQDSEMDENGQYYRGVSIKGKSFKYGETPDYLPGMYEKQEKKRKEESYKSDLLGGMSKEETMAKHFGTYYPSLNGGQGGRSYKLMSKEEKKKAAETHKKVTESLATEYGIAEVTKPAEKPTPEVSVPLPEDGKETSYNQMTESMGLSAFSNQSALPKPSVSTQQETPLTEQEIGFFNPGYQSPSQVNTPAVTATGAATPTPPVTATTQTSLGDERTSSEQEGKNATAAAMIGAKPVSVPKQPQKVMSREELKAQKSEDSKRLALKGAIGDYRKQAAAGTMSPEKLAAKEQELSDLQAKFEERKQSQQTTQTSTSAPSATVAQTSSTGQQASIPTPQTTQTSGPAPTATPDQQQKGPMSYNEIREQRRQQYEQSRYQKQQQYLNRFSGDEGSGQRGKMEERLRSSGQLLTDPNKNNQPPAEAAKLGTSTGTPQASAPMGAPVAAPRAPQGQASQNQGAGVLSNNGFEAFASKLDILLTKLAEVNIPTEIKLTSAQLGVNVTLNGGEVMANLEGKLKGAVFAQVGEQLRNYDSNVTGGEGAQGTKPIGGQRV